MKQEMPLWWRDVDHSICQGIMKYEFIIARLEALLAETLNNKSSMTNSLRWENLLTEAKTASERVVRSLALASSRRRDANALGLIPPSSRDLAARARAASARFRAVAALAKKRIACIRDELRQIGRSRNRPGMYIAPSQIDVHV